MYPVRMLQSMTLQHTNPTNTVAAVCATFISPTVPHAVRFGALTPTFIYLGTTRPAELPPSGSTIHTGVHCSMNPLLQSRCYTCHRLKVSAVSVPTTSSNSKFKRPRCFEAHTGRALPLSCRALGGVSLSGPATDGWSVLAWLCVCGGAAQVIAFAPVVCWLRSCLQVSITDNPQCRHGC